MLRTLALALSLSAISVSLAPEVAPVEIGRVEKAKNAILIRDRHVSDAKRGDTVLSTDVLASRNDGGFILLLKDGSKLYTGAATELRVATHNPETQQTLVELLHGTVRAEVVTVTKPSGVFAIRTPTAYITALGTVVSASVPLIDAGSTRTSSTLSARDLENLPTPNRDIWSLAQLPPGLPPGRGTSPTIADYSGVDTTVAGSLDHVAGVRSVDDSIPGTVYTLPGQFTHVDRGAAPVAPQPIYHFDTWQVAPDWNRVRKDSGTKPDNPPTSAIPQNPLSSTMDYFPCRLGYSLTGQQLWSWDPNHLAPGGSSAPFQYQITGNNISTGHALNISITNNSPCTIELFITSGTVFHPKGFVGRVLTGLLLGGNANLKDFQRETGFGGFIIVPPASPPDWGGGAESSTVTAPIRAFCVDLHKLAPHQKTEYRVANAGEQEKFSSDQPIIGQTMHMLEAGQITPGAQTIDGIIQWALWVHIENLNEKEFHKEFFKIVERNFQAQKKKMDKDTKRTVENLSRDLWTKVDAILRATYK
jgi:FecR protein